MTSSISSAAVQSLKAEALRLGFDGVGITPARTAATTQQGLKDFIAKNRHGEMGWMEETLSRRLSPDTMWAEARSAIVLTCNYGPTYNPLEDLALSEHGVISVYARGRDYHEVIKKRLKTLARWLATQHSVEVKVFVDTAPLMEKPLAAAAGLGWQGKHTNLVSRSHGSWLFLGIILTDAKLLSDEAEIDHCGKCQACLDVCPTNAFPAPYQLDARRCISYLTIEYSGVIPLEFRRAMGNRIYGCDDCLAVCPWNKFAQSAREAAFFARPELTLPRLTELLGLDDASFREVFSGSPIKRIGRNRFIRNVLIAAGNADAASLITPVESLLGDESPIVRATAIWAYRQLASDPQWQEKKAAFASKEQDEAVLEEWR